MFVVVHHVPHVFGLKHLYHDLIFCENLSAQVVSDNVLKIQTRNLLWTIRNRYTTLQILLI